MNSSPATGLFSVKKPKIFIQGAMKLMEGQAYFPETREETVVMGKANYISTIFENELPRRDGPGPNGRPSPFNELPLSGRPVGSSILAQEIVVKCTTQQLLYTRKL